MVTHQSLRTGGGSWADAMRGWLYFGADAAPSARSGWRAGHSPERNNSRGPGNLNGHDTQYASPAARNQQIEWEVAQQTCALEKIIDELRIQQRALESQANHDSLTGLANRKLLRDRFECALQRARRSGENFALLMIDLNDFKAINDTHGHAAGDAVLVAIAQRLKAATRDCDTVARIGGVEFVIIVESVGEPQDIVPLSRKLVSRLSRDVALECGASVSVGASVGVAIYPDDGADLTRMLCVADKAMYKCKTSGQMGL